MGFRLRYLAHNIELPLGDFVIGRSADCQLSVDDPLVSRKHAALRVTEDSVVAEDLGSRNGVLVNGARITKPTPLNIGDKVLVGGQELTLLRTTHLAQTQDSEAFRHATRTLGAINIASLSELTQVDRPEDQEVSKLMGSFRLLGPVADKALAMGHADEAERLLQTVLDNVLRQTRAGRPTDPETAESAARYAVRLGGATLKGAWVDYVVDLYHLLDRPAPASIVDELYTVVRKVKAIDLVALRAYVSRLRERSAQFGPAERFLVQRLEGLERLVALK